MINPDRISTFINSFNMPLTPFLEKLYLECLNKNIPVIRREMQYFLRTMITIADPQSILEVGAALGFSAILMGQYSSKNCKITSIENCEENVGLANKNIEESGMSHKIKIIEGDATEEIPKLNTEFDLVFLDAAKGQYLEFYKGIYPFLKKGSLLISDNIFFGGDILESKYVIERRDRTIHKRMREYLDALTGDFSLYTSIIPLGDGITLSVKL